MEYTPLGSHERPAASLLRSSVSATCWILRKLSPVPEGATKPKWSIIILVVFCLSSCVVNITMLFAYLPQMMRDLGYKEQSLGVYAGLVASSYFVGAFLSSNFWGYAADAYGRKPVILTCLLGTSVCTLCFGFSFNIYWAVVSRFLVGVFNGIIGTTKAVLGDVSDDSNQAVGLAFLSVGWGSGLLLGPSVGGYLSEAATKYSAFMIPEMALFASFPFLLPNLLSALACFIIFLIGLICLPETRNMRQRDRRSKDAPVKVEGSGNEAPKPLVVNVVVQPPPIVITVPQVIPGNNNNNTITGYQVVAPTEINEACLTGTSAVMKSGNLPPENTPTQPGTPDEDTDISISAICSLLADPKVAISTALFSIFSFSCVALDESVPLWAATKQQFGGLGFTTNQLGTMTGAFSIPCLLINVLIFPKLEKHLGCVRTFCLASTVLFLTTIAIPFISDLRFEDNTSNIIHNTSDDITRVIIHNIRNSSGNVILNNSSGLLVQNGSIVHHNGTTIHENTVKNDSLYLWLALIAVLVPNRMTYPICWSAADILINNSVYPKYLGLVNGLSMTFSFLARSASPLAAGSLFSWSITTGYYTLGPPFGHHFVFFVIDVTILACLFIGLFTPRTLDKQPETWDLMEQLPAMKSNDILKRLKEKYGESKESQDAGDGMTESRAEQLLKAHEAEERKVRLYHASFSNSLSFQGPMSHRPLRHVSGSVTEDSSTNASRFLSAKENFSEDGDDTMHEPRSPGLRPNAPRVG